MVKLKTKNIGKILNHYIYSEGKGVLLENKKEKIKMCLALSFNHRGCI